MADKKNLCAQIPAELHAKVVAEKELLGIATLGEYMEKVLNRHFEVGIPVNETKAFSLQLSVELIERLQNYLKKESERTGRKITQREFVTGLIKKALDEAGA